ncbi:OmpA family protein [Flavobacteriaceae bacterium TP-CH-4]|uniref:OmpA family protein n=1 Tax=Pelagihabitans pacificus TaxID=2696054 RepID=A0A967ECR2_9FLAO|nr:OmpA family protein [Pelagihabitans pacificus]NHF61456.1 OmpA family protein [Pelagihabitans pacificus]
MKTCRTLLKCSFLLLFLFAFAPNANSQLLKKLGKRAEKAAERAVERRVEKETTEKTEAALDSILEPGQKGKQGKSPVPQGDAPNEGDQNDNNTNGSSSAPNEGNADNDPESITVYSKFDFVPGDKVMFYDDFQNDFVGDFPSKWNTNGGGEIVTVNDSPEKWLELISGYNIYFLPDVPNLPEEYTIEFDLFTVGLDRRTSSTSKFSIYLSDDEKFKEGSNFVQASLPFCQYSPIGITMENRINDKREIYSVVKADLRDEVLNRPHVSIAVNKQRFRLWVNEEKHIDIPRIAPEGAVLSTLKFHMNNLKDGKERVFITNLKVAEGGVDLRRKLISEGKISTNGILFDSGSANIQPQSMGIIRQISQVLQQETAMKLNIVGHTDSDGEEAANLALSKKRAEAVKNALVSIYNISGDRLQTDGKGETEPVGNNATPDGKAQNRRVEFIKT